MTTVAKSTSKKGLDSKVDKDKDKKKEKSQPDKKKTRGPTGSLTITRR